MSRCRLRLKTLLFCSVILLSLIISRPGFSSEGISSFELCPWKEGQFAEYRIVSLENEGTDNRYMIKITGKETLRGVDHFWINLDIYESGVKQISFKGLIKPFSSIDFSKHTEQFISQGMKVIFRKAEKLFVNMEGGPEYAIDPDILLVQPDILNDTFYASVPDQKNNVDYKKLAISSKKEKVITPAGNFDCYRFSVDSTKKDDYTDEGFDLWRSKQVPLLGIVRADFSKTEYRAKRDHLFLELLEQKNWLGKAYCKLFRKDVRSRVRRDTHSIILLDFKN